MRERGRKRARGDERLAEGRVVVMGYDFAVGRDVLAYVPICVVNRKEYAIVADDGQKTSDAASALEGAVDVQSPYVVRDGDGVAFADNLADNVLIVPDVGGGFY